MEGASTSKGPSKPNRKVIINAQKLFDVLHEESISPQDKFKQITELLNGDDVDVNFPDEYDGRNTLLHGAVSYGYVNIVKLILENGAAVNITNAEGETPLHIAVALGFVNIVELILHAKKADVNEQNVDIIVQKVDVNIQNAKGETALHLVLSDRTIDRKESGKPIFQMLLECKADVNIKNSDGKTLLDLAKEKKEDSIIAILKCIKNELLMVERQHIQDNNITRKQTSSVEATGKENQVQEVTNAFANLPKTYSSSGAKKSMHGTVYQLCLLMLFAIRALVKGYRFHLGTEVDEAEQFDDLVFKYQFTKTDSLKYLLLQAKSKSNTKKGIGLNKLLDDGNKAQFSILKYFKSFVSIKKKKGLEADEFDFAICTNTHFKFGEPGVLIENDKKLSFELVTNICEGFFKEGQCYKIIADKETLKWLTLDFDQKLRKEKEKFGTKEVKKNEEYDNILFCLNDTQGGTFRIFLDKLVFIVNQTADIEVVKAEFREYSKINHPDTKLHTDAFYKQIFDWSSKREGVWLTNEMAEEMIGSICDNAFATSVSQVYVEKSQTSNIKFNIGTLDKLKARISENTIVNLITPVETKLTLLQVAQALECFPAHKAHGFIFIHYSSLLLSETLERTLRAFDSPRNNNLLVIDCLSEKKDNSMENLTKLPVKLKNITTKNTLKQILLISPENHVLSEMFQTWPGYYSDHVKHVFEDFADETQNVFLATKVNFQGQLIELNQVIGTSETELLQNIPLETLIGDEGLVIGQELPSSDGYNELYYMDRTVSYKKVIKADIFEAKSREKFIDEIASSDTEFLQLCSQHPNSNIHLIEKQGDKFIWVKSHGKLTELRPYFDNDNTETCSEKLFLDLVKRQRVVIISDSAGTGKSTILTHISKIFQIKHRGTLVLRIDLNNHTEALREQSEKKEDNISLKDSFLEGLLLITPFEKKLLKRNGKAVWMFDGFDEISPTYNETVLDFIHDLLETTECQIWITTRTFMAEELEKKLHQRSYTLEAFSKAHQIELLTKYWKHMENRLQDSEEDLLRVCAESIIKKFTSSINDKKRAFTGIPSLLKMLAECFDGDFANTLEWENCFNLVDVYDKFIKKKLTVFNFEKNKIDYSKVGAIEELKEKIEEYEIYHQRIAIRLIFPANKVLLLPTGKQDNNSRTEMKLNRIGIVNIIDGVPFFIHHTFAEYFVADYLSKLLIQLRSINTEERDFVFSQLLVSDEYKVIRGFLNGLLAKKEKPYRLLQKRVNKTILKANLKNGFNGNEFLEPSFNKASLKTAEEGNEQIFLYLFDYGLVHPTKIRNLLECTPKEEETMLHLAINNNSAVYIKTLLQWILDNIDEGQETVKHMLLAADTVGDTVIMVASHNGHTDVVQTLLQWTCDNVNVGNEIVKQMLLATNVKGITALIRASTQGHTDVVQTILQWIRDNEDLDEDRETLMLLAGDNYGNNALTITSN